MTAATFFTASRIFPSHHHVSALIAVPHRDSVSPPKLAGNAPILDVLEPVNIGILPFLWEESNLIISPGIKGLLSHGIHLYEPLFAQIRFHNCATAIAMANFMRMVLFSNVIALSLQIIDYKLSCLKDTKISVLLRTIIIQGSIRVEYVNGFKTVPFSTLIVIRVMGRSDLDHACSKCYIDKAVSNDRDLPVSKWQNKHLANDILVALIIRVQCDCDITEHSLRTGRRHCDES